MALLTMAEALRAIQVPTPTTAGVIKTFDEESPILRLLKFKQGIGGKVSVNRWKTLPASAPRALNAEFVATVGETETIEEDLEIYGGRVELDDAIEDRTPGALAQQEMMQLTAMARKWNYDYFKGSGASNEMTGQQLRITGDQVHGMGANPLNLNFLDKFLLNIRGGDRANVKLIMGADMEALIWQYARTKNNVNYVPANLGESPSSYNGYEIVNAGQQIDDTEVLDFSEGVGTDETSIYIISFDEIKGSVGAQTTLPKVKMTNTDSTVESYKVQWDSNFQNNTLRGAYRLHGITDAAIVG